MPYTWKIGYKHFEYEKHFVPIISREYPYEWKQKNGSNYPLNNDRNNAFYLKYIEFADKSDLSVCYKSNKQC